MTSYSLAQLKIHYSSLENTGRPFPVKANGTKTNPELCNIQVEE